MSALGQKQTFAPQEVMSALPPKADMCGARAHVCFGPQNLELSHYRSIIVFAGISSGNPGVLPKVSRRCSHVSSCSGFFGMVT